MKVDSFTLSLPAYLAAHKIAEQELRANHICSYLCSHHSERGRQIFFESDQGWNPEPFYEDFPVEACVSHDEAAYC